MKTFLLLRDNMMILTIIIKMDNIESSYYVPHMMLIKQFRCISHHNSLKWVLVSFYRYGY